jgi:hypothetical protein
MNVRRYTIWAVALFLSWSQGIPADAQQQQQQQPTPKPVTPPPVVPGQKPPREPAMPGQQGGAEAGNTQVATSRNHPLVAGEDAAVQPFLDDNVLAVARIDLDALDVHAYQQWLAASLEHSKLDPQRRHATQDKLARDTDRADRWVQALRKSGARRLYLVSSLSDATDRPAFLVVPIGAGVDAQSLSAAIISREAGSQHVSAERIGNAVVAATAATLKRLKEAPAAHPNADLASAMSASDPAPLRIAVIPGPDVRKTLQSASPNLPDELGGGPITNVTLGMRWIALSLTAPPQPTVKFIVQARDPQDAKLLLGLAGKTADAIRARAKDWELPFDVERATTMLMPKLREDRIVTDLDAEQTRAFAGSVLIPMLGEHLGGDEPAKQ